MTRVTSPLLRGAFRNSTASQRAFSLIEVVLAVGVVAFAFVAIMGLIPAGMGQFRQAIDTSVCSQIAQRIINEAQQTDFTLLIDEKNIPANQETFAFRLPTIASTRSAPNKCIRYFDEQGNEIIPQNLNTNVFTTAENPTKARVTYQVNVRVTPKGLLPNGTNPTYYAPHLATLAIQVAYNPGFIPIKVSTAAENGTDPTRRMWIKTPGVSMINYSAQVSRN